MEATATFRYLRVSPRKLVRVVNQVRGKNIQEALDILKFDRKVNAKDIAKLIRSAMANAMQKGGVKPQNLFVKTIYVNPGPILKRWASRARGASARIQKKMSHVTVVVDEKL